MMDISTILVSLLVFAYLRNLFLVTRNIWRIFLDDGDVYSRKDSTLADVLRVAGVFIIPLGVVMGLVPERG